MYLCVVLVGFFLLFVWVLLVTSLILFGIAHLHCCLDNFCVELREESYWCSLCKEEICCCLVEECDFLEVFKLLRCFAFCNTQ